MARRPLHPLLLGAFPVLSLWAQNATEIESMASPPRVLGVVLAGVVVLWLVGRAVLGSWSRGALAASPVAFVFLAYGRVVPNTAPALTAPVVIVALALAAVWACRRLDAAALETATTIANVFGGVLVTMTVVPLALFSFRSSDPVELPEPVISVEDGAQPVGQDARDIYYIIMDRYSREDWLREGFGFDNRAFTSALKDKGFQVLDGAVANYNKTAHSLASALNMTYLDELSMAVSDDRSGDWHPLYRMLDDHTVGDVLTARGYEYVHLGMWWSPTADAADADVVLNRQRVSEFTRIFETTTALPALRRALGGEDDSPRRRNAHAHVLYQFEQLERLSDMSEGRPRFVLAHVALPHEPYTFAADGSFVPADVAHARSRRDNYVEQLRYANSRLLPILERLLDRPEEEQPIILLVSDEGPHPLAYSEDEEEFDWTAATATELRQKFRILSALYLPGTGPVPDDLTPVNLFRVVFSRYLGVDMDLLPDRSFVFRDESHLYDFSDVTEIVRR